MTKRVGLVLLAIITLRVIDPTAWASTQARFITPAATSSLMRGSERSFEQALGPPRPQPIVLTPRH